jgi:uncharacterized RDD family membrane protein YckC
LLLDIVGYSIFSTLVNNVYGVTQVTSGTLPNGHDGFASWSSVTTVDWSLAVVIWVAYSLVPEALFGATPGKLLTGLRVVRVDGRPLGLGAVVARNLLRVIDALPALYLIGGVAVLATTSSQRLGDLVAGTTVVARSAALDSGATRSTGRWAGVVLAAALVVAILFTIFFDYYGRPPLVLQGLYNQHQLLRADVTSYQLGTAHWYYGRVTYPITIYTAQNRCTGTVELDWVGLGWEMRGADYNCSG